MADRRSSMNHTTRRDILRTSLYAGAALLLGGCQSSPYRKSRTVIQPVLPPSPQTEDWSFHTQKPAWLGDTPNTEHTFVPTGVHARTQWTTSKPSFREADPMHGVSRITIHHDGMTPFIDISRTVAARRIESIRRVHVNTNGWADIGYHYIIDPAGRIWEGRPISLQGAHVKYNNPHNVGVMVLGNYEKQSPTNASLHALDGFVARLMRFYRVPVSRVYTHQELRPTMCPGRNLQRAMEYTRSRGGTLARA